MLGTCLLRGWTVLPSLEVSNARLLGLFCVECRGGCRSLLGLGGKAGRTPLLCSGGAHAPASCSSAATILGEPKMFSNVSLVPCLICICWTYGVLASPCWIFLSECMAGKSSAETFVCDLFFGEGVLGGDGGGDALDFFTWGLEVLWDFPDLFLGDLVGLVGGCVLLAWRCFLYVTVWKPSSWDNCCSVMPPKAPLRLAQFSVLRCGRRYLWAARFNPFSWFSTKCCN